MNAKKWVVGSLPALFSMGLLSGQSFGGDCEVPARPIVAGGQDIITISCQRDGVAATVGQVGHLDTLTRAFISSAPQSGNGRVTTTGLDSAGNVIASCTAVASQVGGDPVAKICPSMVRWAGTVAFDEFICCP
jgi:hypothetical protein